MEVTGVGDLDMGSEGEEWSMLIRPLLLGAAEWLRDVTEQDWESSGGTLRKDD